MLFHCCEMFTRNSSYLVYVTWQKLLHFPLVTHSFSTKESVTSPLHTCILRACFVHKKKWSQANIFTQQLTLSKLQKVKNFKSQMIFTLILRSRPSAFITRFTAIKSISYGSGFHFTSLFFFFFRLKPKITYKRNSVITLTEVNWYLIRRFTPEESVSPKAWL